MSIPRHHVFVLGCLIVLALAAAPPAVADNMGCCVLPAGDCTTATKTVCRLLRGNLQGVGTQICDTSLGCVRGKGCAMCFGGEHAGELCEQPGDCGPGGACMTQVSMAEPADAAAAVLATPGIPSLDKLLDLRLRDLQLRERRFQYAVQVVCGDPQPRGVALARGRYATAVNVHNPSPNLPVSFRYKVAVALPGAQQGPISGFQNARLDADGALEIDCPTIIELGRDPIFVKGFLVIETQQELDVVAVYTAGEPGGAAFGGGLIQGLEIERVEPRDLTQPLLVTPAP